jgi:glutamine amidotransferase PdxT
MYDILEPFRRYTYTDIEILFTPILESLNIKVNKTSIGRYLNSFTTKKRVTTDGKKETIYIKK